MIRLLCLLLLLCAGCAKPPPPPDQFSADEMVDIRVATRWVMAKRDAEQQANVRQFMFTNGWAPRAWRSSHLDSFPHYDTLWVHP